MANYGPKYRAKPNATPMKRTQAPAEKKETDKKKIVERLMAHVTPFNRPALEVLAKKVMEGAPAEEVLNSQQMRTMPDLFWEFRNILSGTEQFMKIKGHSYE
jgi:hypothetical protein